MGMEPDAVIAGSAVLAFWRLLPSATAWAFPDIGKSD
jgi:hypothetical protein